MRPLLRMRAGLTRLLRSETGAVAPLLGVLMLILIGCMGFGIDVGRSMIVKARLVDALDAAGLAVGGRAVTTDYNGDAQRFVTANFKALYAGATVTSVTATPSSDKSVISLAATATMPTAFMRLFGVPLVTVNATSEVTRATTGLELAIVLDNTGSMDDSGSMPGLKTAGKALVNYLFGSATSAPDDLFLSLVPFSQAVNIGAGADRALWTDLNTVNPLTRPFYPLTWTGCVEARNGGLDLTDAPPNVLVANSIFAAYYSPDVDERQPKSTRQTALKLENNWIKSNGVTTDIKYVDKDNQQGPGAYCPTPITPLTNVKKTVLDAIDAMKAQGSTLIGEGLVWGWRTISPSWRGRWGGVATTYKLPLDYGTKNMSKAIVLMTDGKNSFAPGNYTAYDRLTDKRLVNSTDQDRAEAELDVRLTKICNNVKAAGVMVITVAYDNPEGDTKSLLQNCASNSTLYFDAANTSELLTSFVKIAGALSNLRVTK